MLFQFHFELDVANCMCGVWKIATALSRSIDDAHADGGNRVMKGKQTLSKVIAPLLPQRTAQPSFEPWGCIHAAAAAAA